MRRLLPLALVAAAFTAVPANAYLLNGCNSGDFVVADVDVAGIQVAKVCTTTDPRDLLEADICGLECILDK